jgi:molybdate transport system substrate-binding protein
VGIILKAKAPFITQRTKDQSGENVMHKSAMIVVGLFITIGTARAAEITCLVPIALKSTLSELIPQFEKTSGHTVKPEYGLIGVITARLQKDEIADVAILSDGQIVELQKQGKVVEGSRAGVAKLGLGAFMRKDVTKPDISSVDSFKQVLLAAKAIAYIDPATGAPSGVYMAKLVERLGIVDDMKPKTKLTAPEGPLFNAVVGGDADIGFTLISEILAEERVQFTGSLPPAIQNNIPYSAGLVLVGEQKEAGKALINYLTSSSAQAVFRTKGFEPF